MRQKRFPPDDPREWLRRARSNLAHALSRNPEVCLEDLCFDAQQAAEKAIKAVFVARGEHFPFIHDLEQLLQLLERNGLKAPKYVMEAEKLSPFAVITRYPGTVGLRTRATLSICNLRFAGYFSLRGSRPAAHTTIRRRISSDNFTLAA
jgi:HEPN domain-containing protein